MANNVTGNPFIIDTAGASAVYTGPLVMDRFRWVGATTVAHQCVVTDGDGKVLFESFATGPNYVDETYCGDQHKIIRDLKVPTLGSGKLYVYFR